MNQRRGAVLFAELGGRVVWQALDTDRFYVTASASERWYTTRAEIAEYGHRDALWTQELLGQDNEWHDAP